MQPLGGYGVRHLLPSIGCVLEQMFRVLGNFSNFVHNFGKIGLLLGQNYYNGNYHSENRPLPFRVPTSASQIATRTIKSDYGHCSVGT